MSTLKAPPQANVNATALSLGKDLGRRLRYMRARLGITQCELARRTTGMSRAYLSKLEHGKILPRYTTLVRLAAALEVDVADLVRTSSRQTNSANVTEQAQS